MYFAKIGGVEYALLTASVRTAGSTSLHSPAVVNMRVEMEYAAAKELFTEPGEWYLIERYEPIRYADGTVIQRPDLVTDCTEYNDLLSIKDTMDGVLEIEMGGITDSEALTELVEVLNG